jgi:CBS domain-containing protein
VLRPGRHNRISSKEANVKVQEAMKTNVQIASPDQPIRAAAGMMARIDAGALPVGHNDRLVGMITDRDIAVRAVAEGLGPDTPVAEVMSNEVCYCYADQDLAEVAANMADVKVRRFPVVDRQKRLVGIVSLGDIALSDGHDEDSAAALCAISEPGGEHSQGSEDPAAVQARRVGPGG